MTATAIADRPRRTLSLSRPVSLPPQVLGSVGVPQAPSGRAVREAVPQPVPQPPRRAERAVVRAKALAAPLLSLELPYEALAGMAPIPDLRPFRAPEVVFDLIVRTAPGVKISVLAGVKGGLVEQARQRVLEILAEGMVPCVRIEGSLNALNGVDHPRLTVEARTPKPTKVN